MKFNKFISELNRRHVFKATIAYLAIAWVVIQIASAVLPAFNAPAYALKGLIYLLAIGIIFWIPFAWIYDLTPGGIQKTDISIDNEESLKSTNRRLNRVIAGSLVTAVILLVTISFWAGSKWNNGIATQISKTVAVLPLIHNTENEDDDWFEFGMTEALIDELSKVDQLTVMDHTSTQAISLGFGAPNSFLSNVISEIDYYINGEIERELNKIIVHIELKESVVAPLIWQKDYTKDISEVRKLWAEVSEDLSRQMGIIVLPGDAVLWSRFRSVNPETYELYLKGINYLHKSNPNERYKGIGLLEEAKNKNPADPFAWAALAEAYVDLGHSPAPPPGVFPKALVASQRAIELDSTVALGWAALSHYHTYFGKDWAMAEYAFERANELNPNLAANHYHRAWYLALFGRMNEAIVEHKRAQELDPFSPGNTGWLGELYRMVGKYEEGLAEAEKLFEMGYNDGGMFLKSRIYIDQGKVEEGLQLLRQASEINPGWKDIGLGPALIQTGYIDEGSAILKKLEELPVDGYNALCIGIMYAQLGDLDKAFESWSYENKHAWFPWLRVTFVPKEIKNDPRFLKMIRDMNLPDPSPLIYNPEL